MLSDIEVNFEDEAYLPQRTTLFFMKEMSHGYHPWYIAELDLGTLDLPSNYVISFGQMLPSYTKTWTVSSPHEQVDREFYEQSCWSLFDKTYFDRFVQPMDEFFV